MKKINVQKIFRSSNNNNLKKNLSRRKKAKPNFMKKNNKFSIKSNINNMNIFREYRESRIIQK